MPILDQVVGTVLSQHTSDVNSGRASARLKARFPAWDQAAHAPVEEIEDAIRCGGLARQKARRIQEILNAIDEPEVALTSVACMTSTIRRPRVGVTARRRPEDGRVRTRVLDGTSRIPR